MLSIVGLKQKIWLRLLTWFAKLLIMHRVQQLTVKFLKWYGSRSPLNYPVLQIFGCEMYVGIPKDQITGWMQNPKSVFFLTANETKGYRLWDPTNHKIIIC